MPTIPALPAAPTSDGSGLLIIDISGVTYSITRNNLLDDASSAGILLRSGSAILSVYGPDKFTIQDGSGVRLDAADDGSLNITCGAAGALRLQVPASAVVAIDVGGGAAAQASQDGTGTPVFRISNRLQIGFFGSGSTLGTVVGGFAVYDTSGALLGYVPLYDSIT